MSMTLMPSNGPMAQPRSPRCGHTASHCCADQVTAGTYDDQGAHSVWPYARDGGYFFDSYFLDLASRSRVRRSSSSFCWLRRSAMRASFRSPEAAAACSINCRILSFRILIRLFRFADYNELLLLMIHAPVMAKLGLEGN